MGNQLEFCYAFLKGGLMPTTRNRNVFVLPIINMHILFLKCNTFIKFYWQGICFLLFCVLNYLELWVCGEHICRLKPFELSAWGNVCLNSFLALFSIFDGVGLTFYCFGWLGGGVCSCPGPRSSPLGVASVSPPKNHSKQASTSYFVVVCVLIVCRYNTKILVWLIQTKKKSADFYSFI